jgi:anti-sigma factor RsiW
MTTASKQPASPIDDEGLSALLDDELTAEDAQRLRLRLLADPALAARLEALDSATATVRGAYARVADEALPPQLLELLRDQHDRRTPPGDRVQRMRRVLAAPAIAVPLLLAAGVALGLLLGTPRLAGDDDVAPPFSAAGRVPPGGSLYELLENMPSGVPGSLAAGWTASVTQTFPATGQEFCRRIELAHMAAASGGALACRGSGGWRVDAAIFTVSAATRPVLESLAAARATSAPLDGESERELIARGWPAPTPTP